jgi:hypothetical protein
LLPRKNYPRAKRFNGLSPSEARKLRTAYDPKVTEVVDLQTIDETDASPIVENSEREKYMRRFGCLKFVSI